TNFNLALGGAENIARSKLTGKKWWLNEWSEPLWNGDYRDEGTGNLDVTRGPDTSADAGMEWLEQTKKPGAIKRRCIKQIIGNQIVFVVNNAWYSTYQYGPVPASPYI